MTLIPAVLVLLVGSELIRNSVDRWFNAPMDEMLSSAKQIASDYYQRAAADWSTTRPAGIAARSGAARPGDRATSPACGAVVDPHVTEQRVALVEVYRVGAGGRAAGRGDLRGRGGAPGPTLGRPGYDRAAADRLAARAAGRDRRAARAGAARDGGELIRGVRADSRRRTAGRPASWWRATT